MQFKNRRSAGQHLAKDLAVYADKADVLVLALPRGGVPVAFEVAKALNVPLDVFVVRKLGVPGREELAMGAIASGGVQVLNDEIVESIPNFNQVITLVAAKEKKELERRESLYRGDRPFPIIQGRIVILVDDGLATGATMRAAVEALRNYQPASIVIAVPVSAPETYQKFADEVEEIVCAVIPKRFYSVGLWYEDFPQTTDEEVRNLLTIAANGSQSAVSGEKT